jgi:hypothetical protein
LKLTQAPPGFSHTKMCKKLHVEDYMPEENTSFSRIEDYAP